MLDQGQQLQLSKRKLWNLKQKNAIRKLYGRTPMEMLFEHFTDFGFELNIEKDSDGRITHFFFAHSKNVELLRKNCDVLLLYCTYKASKTRFPLLHVLGNTMLYSTFSAAFVFMKNEDADSYATSINFLRRLFHSDHQPKYSLLTESLLS